MVYFIQRRKFIYCKTCGKEVNDQAVICPHCGCQLVAIVEPEKTEPAKKKINVLCIVGFVLFFVSLLLALYGTVAIAGLVLSIIGLVQANKNGERLKGLGIAGICVAAGSLIYTVYTLIALATLLATL